MVESLDVNYFFLISVIIATLLIIFLIGLKLVGACNKNNQPQILNSLDVLQILQKIKPFPVGINGGWKLHAYGYDQRIWTRPLMCDFLRQPLSVYGCYSKVKGSSQVVLKHLCDISKWNEWDPDVNQIQYVSMATEPTNTNKSKSSPGLPVQHDIVRWETDMVSSLFVTLINQLFTRLQGAGLVRRVKTIHRFWHREDNGCCWLLESNEDQQEWTFYLAQPVEEMDQCLFTVIMSPSRQQTTSELHLLSAFKLACFQNYFFYRKLQCTPLQNIRLPSAETLLHEEQEEEEATLDPAPTVATPVKEEENHSPKTKNVDPGGKPETTLIQRFKNLIEEKKEWYEERKKRSSSSSSIPPSSSKTDLAAKILSNGPSKDAADGSISESSDDDDLKENNFVEESLNDEHLKENKAKDRRKEENHSDETKEELPKEEHKKHWRHERSFLKFLRSSTTIHHSVDESEENVAKDTSNNKKLAKRSLSLNLPKKPKFLVDRDSQEKDTNDEDDLESPSSMPEEDMDFTPEQKFEMSLRMIGNQAASDIMAEKGNISNIDIGRSYDEQAERTGGWIYCGLEKEVVILRKLFDDGTPVQSYLGKGLIASSPKAVFEALKNPRTRFTYDEMLKKVDVLHDFGSGLKLLYLSHEVTQLFRKESRDFCILQSEREEEDERYIISMRSVSWPGCPEHEEITRGQFLPSGWIIEPAIKDKKMYSMVTYISQMDLGPSKSGNSGYLMEELSAKQPVSIAYLRQYLVPTVSPITKSTSGHLRSRRTPGSSTGTLAAAAAANSMPDSGPVNV